MTYHIGKLTDEAKTTAPLTSDLQAYKAMGLLAPGRSAFDWQVPKAEPVALTREEKNRRQSKARMKAKRAKERAIKQQPFTIGPKPTAADKAKTARLTGRSTPNGSNP